MNSEKWKTIDNKDRFRLLCDNPKCLLSICNLYDGKLHITTIHSNERHSKTFSNEDMIFIISQFMKSLNKKDRMNLLEFYSKF